MFIWLKHSWAVTTVVLHHIYIETWWQQSSKKFKNLIKTLIESSTDVWYDYKFLAVISVEPSVYTIKETYMYGHMREICTGVIVNEKKDKFRMDSLASINIINQCHRTQSHIKLSYKTLKIRNGEDLKSLGTTRLKVKNLKTQKKYSIEFVVVPDSVTPLIGTHSAQQLELISVHQDNLLQFHPHRGHCARISGRLKQLACSWRILEPYQVQYIYRKIKMRTHPSHPRVEFWLPWEESFKLTLTVWRTLKSQRKWTSLQHGWAVLSLQPRSLAHWGYA